MIKVSEKYLEMSKLEENNYKHKYKIMNITRKLDLTPLLINESLEINRFLRTSQGNLSPNTVSLSFSAEQGDKANILIKDFHRKYNEFKHMRWKDILNVEFIEEFLVKNNDIVLITEIFNNEEIILFKGKTRKVTRIDTDTGRRVEITIEDSTIVGYENKFSEDLVFENIYISNNQEKEKSILHILCKMLGFEYDNMDIADMKYKNGNFLKIPLLRLKKDKKIMEEISEIIKSVYGNIYTLPNGNIKITSELDKSYIKDTEITLGNKKGNYPILSFIENTEIEPKENKVEVKYSNSVLQERKAVFVLAGQNADFESDDARIRIKKNSKGKEWWKVEFKDCVNIEKKPLVVAYILTKPEPHTQVQSQSYSSSNTSNVEKKIKDSYKKYIDYKEYELAWEENTQVAKLKFNNSKNYEIFIEKFKFFANPIIKFKNNYIIYTEIKNLTNYNIKTVDNQYINSKEQATEIAKHTYYNECRAYSRIKLQTNNMPFLELEDVVHLDYNKYKGEYKIIAIKQTNEYTEILLKLYREYEAFEENFITEIVAKNNEDLLNSKSNITKEEKPSESNKEIAKLKSSIEALQNDVNTKFEKLTEQLSTFASFIQEYKKIEPKLNKIISNYKEIDYMNKNEVLAEMKKIKNKAEFDKIFSSKRIRRMITNNPDMLLYISKNDTILNIMYDNYKKIIKGARQTVSGGKYIILEVSSSNAYSSSYGETRRNGTTLDSWSDLKGKFQYFKKYPNYVDYIRNDTEDDDYVYYYDFEI